MYKYKKYVWISAYMINAIGVLKEESHENESLICF